MSVSEEVGYFTLTGSLQEAKHQITQACGNISSYKSV